MTQKLVTTVTITVDDESTANATAILEQLERGNPDGVTVELGKYRWYDD